MTNGDLAAKEFSDDPTIPDDADLWRRIHPNHVVRDGNLGCERPSSAAFTDHPNGTPMSVLLADVVDETGRNAADVLQAYIGYSLASITAALARACGQGIVRTPLPDEPAHAEVYGEKPKKIRRRLARAAQWVVPPAKA